ncbi:MAG: DUF167 domain-containing protein [Candidatus Gracilibacteria bacterium]
MNIQIPRNNYLRVKVIPKSATNEVSEILADGTIKIRLKAVPERGKANAELIKFLSKELKIATEQISIISGKSERIKLIKIKNEPDR